MSVVSPERRSRMRTHPGLIAAMRADKIPAPQDRGLWYIQRQDLGALWAEKPKLERYLAAKGAFDEYPEIPHVMTSLCRWTDDTIYSGQGESVMSDDPMELRKHLPIVLAASGRVLISGLGLGCVVRGLLARPAVTRIDVVEIDPDILTMVAASFNGEPRVTFRLGDALTCEWPRGTVWDWAWHDIWSETPSTHLVHCHLLARYRSMVRHQQGAWALPRWIKKIFRDPLLGASSERRLA